MCTFCKRIAKKHAKLKRACIFEYCAIICLPLNVYIFFAHSFTFVHSHLMPLAMCFQSCISSIAKNKLNFWRKFFFKTSSLLLVVIFEIVSKLISNHHLVSNMNETSSELLSFYYRTLFPCKLFYKWLSYSNGLSVFHSNLAFLN